MSNHFKHSVRITLLLITWVACATTSCNSALAGMPSLLPSDWIKDSPNPWYVPTATNHSFHVLLQGISFFIVCLLASAWGLQRLCKFLAKDFPILEKLGYARSLSLVILWGLSFVVVLTMISGARELMTPGAWRKQGWTYQLAQSNSSSKLESDIRELRQEALKDLRQRLWQYAATHEGSFPTLSDADRSNGPWMIPSAPQLSFCYVAGQKAEESGKLLVFEPELDGDERLVLLTNGFIGRMRTDDIREALAARVKP